MAKKVKDLYVLRSEKTKFQFHLFVKKRSEAKKQSVLDPKKKQTTGKLLTLKKYDPILRQHVEFKFMKAKK